MNKITSVLVSFLAGALLAGGIFLAVVGAINGFGNPTILFRVGFCAGGLALAVVGLYILYLANGRSVEKTIDAIVDFVTFSS